MKAATVLVLAACGFATAKALAKRQLDITDLLDAYDAVASNLTSVAAPMGDDEPELSSTYDNTTTPARKRVDDPPGCTRITFNGPAVWVPDDTAQAFLAYQPFADAANNAPVPEGYHLVENFVNLHASCENPSYLTYTSSRLSSYDPNTCADICNEMARCVAFNICKIPAVSQKERVAHTPAFRF
jgi:hypothetical protein